MRSRFTGTSGRNYRMASNASFSDTFMLFVVHRSPRPACLPGAHSSCRGEQVGPAERSNHSVLNWKATCARPVTLVVLSTGCIWLALSEPRLGDGRHVLQATACNTIQVSILQTARGHLVALPPANVNRSGLECYQHLTCTAMPIGWQAKRTVRDETVGSLLLGWC